MAKKNNKKKMYAIASFVVFGLLLLSGWYMYNNYTSSQDSSAGSCKPVNFHCTACNQDIKFDFCYSKMAEVNVCLENESNVNKATNLKNYINKKIATITSKTGGYADAYAKYLKYAGSDKLLSKDECVAAKLCKSYDKLGLGAVIITQSTDKNLIYVSKIIRYNQIITTKYNNVIETSKDPKYAKCGVTLAAYNSSLKKAIESRCQNKCSKFAPATEEEVKKSQPPVISGDLNGGGFSDLPQECNSININDESELNACLNKL